MFQKNKFLKTTFITIILIGIAVLAFYIRMQTFTALHGTLNMVAGPDGWYYLRMAELSVANNLGYVPYDPYLVYPDGGGTRSGSLFVRICALAAILCNCVTQMDFISVLSYIPPIMAVCIIPIVYFLGKKLGDWKTGLIAALLIAILGGQYLIRTMYGYIDHHAAETLLSTLFCLSYIAGLSALKDYPDKLSINMWKKPAIYGLLAGFTFFLGFQNLYVMSVFVFIVLIFTTIQFIINQKNQRPTEYLVVFNTVTFISAAIGYFVVGITGLNEFSAKYIIVHLLPVIITFAFYALSKLIYRLKKPWYIYLLSVLGAGAFAVIILKLFANSIFTSLLSSFMFFFGYSATANTIGEMSAWSLYCAFSSFNIFLLFAVGGVIWLVVKIKKEYSSASLFVLVWAGVLFAATCMHIRFEYYFAVCIALLAAVCISETVKLLNGIHTEENEEKYLKISSLILIIGLVAAGAGISIVSSIDATNSAKASGTISPYFDETCEWLLENTPDTGIPIYDNYSRDKIYESAKPYGIMSWWDYGYYIIEIAKRMPTANPGQAGAADVSRILCLSDEERIAEQLEALGVKYIIVTEEMSKSFVPEIWVWANKEAKINSYITQLLNANGFSGEVYSPAFYQSLLTRLYCYDGSAMHPEQVGVIYTSQNRNGGQKIESIEVFDGAEEAANAVEIYNQKSENDNNGKYAYPASIDGGDLPCVNLDAFTCFRLVHESPLSHVKVFEFVNGAHISGDGIIECEVTTDQGRTFTYRQESENGEFIVPYVTGKNGDIIASEYRIAGTEREIFVPEEAVQAKEY